MSRYGIENLPYGVFSGADGTRRIGVRLGSRVVDLSPAGGLLAASTLNPLLAAGRPAWAAARAEAVRQATSSPGVPLDEVTLHLPFEVADYTDFYSSEHHALNTGQILRPQSPGLTPSWRRLPIGYHGRSATVVVSGTPVERPSGQLADGVFGPSRRLDIEAEVGFVVGVPGRRLRTTDFAGHVFGIVLLNDWSARDIQAFEYRPLGPFLGKSFATSISPWVVPLEALALGGAEDAVRQVVGAVEAHSYPPLIRPSRTSSVSGSTTLVAPNPTKSGRRSSRWERAGSTSGTGWVAASTSATSATSPPPIASIEAASTLRKP